jgi:epoxyqueuosine reductase
VTRRAGDDEADAARVTREVLSRYMDAGFVLAGVAPVQPALYGEHVRQWLAAGMHGDMAYLEQDLLMRLEPWRVLQGTRAFIAVADQYASRQDGPEAAVEGRGRVARYARGRNYHEVMKRRLHRVADGLRADYPGSDFRTCVDTAPVMERELATLAGLGWLAKNTMMIHPRVGSYLLLGVVATTMELVPQGEAERVVESCGTCTRCIDACPTGAITPWRVDARRCISYLTIEHRGLIDVALAPKVQDWVYGCDVCQEVCPHNSPRGGEVDVGRAHEAYAQRQVSLDVLEVLGWGEAERRAAFQSSAMKRASLAMMRRNAVLVLAGWIERTRDELRRAAWVARLEAIAGDATEEELVRETARRARAGLSSGSA